MVSKRRKPIKFIPPADAVRESLNEARRDVDTLEYLLTVAEEVERRQSSTGETGVTPSGIKEASPQ